MWRAFSQTYKFAHKTEIAGRNIAPQFPKVIDPIEIQITALANQESSSIIKWLVLTQNVTPQTLGINDVYGAHC